MRPWHYYAWFLMPMGLFVYAMPEGYRYDHPWRYLAVLCAMVIDNIIGYEYGLAEGRKAKKDA